MRLGLDCKREHAPSEQRRGRVARLPRSCEVGVHVVVARACVCERSGYCERIGDGTDSSRQDVARGLRRGGAAGGGAAGKGCCGGFVERFEGRDLGFVNGCGFDRFV